MIELDDPVLHVVAERVRKAYFYSERRSDYTQWQELPVHRRRKWLIMAAAALQVAVRGV